MYGPACLGLLKQRSYTSIVSYFPNVRTLFPYCTVSTVFRRGKKLSQYKWVASPSKVCHYVLWTLPFFLLYAHKALTVSWALDLFTLKRIDNKNSTPFHWRVLERRKKAFYILKMHTRIWCNGSHIRFRIWWTLFVGVQVPLSVDPSLKMIRPPNIWICTLEYLSKQK